MSTPIALPEKLTVFDSIFNSRASSIHFSSRNPEPVSSNLSAAGLTELVQSSFTIFTEQVSPKLPLQVAMMTLGVIITGVLSIFRAKVVRTARPK